MGRFRATFDDPERMPEDMAHLAVNFEVHPMGSDPFFAQIQGGRVGESALFQARSSGAEIASVGPLGYWSVTIPTGAPLTELRESTRLPFGCDRAWVCGPDEPFGLEMAAQASCQVVNVFGASLERHAAMLQGISEGTVDRALPRYIALSTPVGLAFQRFVRFLGNEISTDSPTLTSRMVAAQLEATLLTVMLNASRPEGAEFAEAPQPRHLHLALDYVEAHLGEPLSLGAIAAGTGVRAHTLQRTFRRYRDTTLMGYVRNRRMERARHMLLDAEPERTTVTEVALNLGFAHLGRFSIAYRKRYGESPSATLRGRETRSGPFTST